MKLSGMNIEETNCLGNVRLHFLFLFDAVSRRMGRRTMECEPTESVER